MTDHAVTEGPLWVFEEPLHLAESLSWLRGIHRYPITGFSLFGDLVVGESLASTVTIDAATGKSTVGAAVDLRGWTHVCGGMVIGHLRWLPVFVHRLPEGSPEEEDRDYLFLSDRTREQLEVFVDEQGRPMSVGACAVWEGSVAVVLGSGKRVFVKVWNRKTHEVKWLKEAEFQKEPQRGPTLKWEPKLVYRNGVLFAQPGPVMLEGVKADEGFWLDAIDGRLLAPFDPNDWWVYARRPDGKGYLRYRKRGDTELVAFDMEGAVSWRGTFPQAVEVGSNPLVTEKEAVFAVSVPYGDVVAPNEVYRGPTGETKPGGSGGRFGAGAVRISLEDGSLLSIYEIELRQEATDGTGVPWGEYDQAVDREFRREAGVAPLKAGNLLILPAVGIVEGDKKHYLFPVFDWESGKQVAALKTLPRPSDELTEEGADHPSTWHMEVVGDRFYASTGDYRLWCFDLSELSVHSGAQE